MCDIDLLVKKADLARAEEIMEEMDFDRTHEQEGEAEETFYHFGYLQRKKGLRAEIHWDLLGQLYGLSVDIEALWIRSRPNVAAGNPALAMAPEDQVLHLCIHTSYHSFLIGLRAICDISETLQYYHKAMDWNLLCMRASQWSALCCVCLNLWMAKKSCTHQYPTACWLPSA